MPTRVRIPSPALKEKMKSNKHLEELVRKLRKAAIENDAAVWRKIAKELERPTRMMREVNLFKIEKYGREGEIIVVPGKILGVGEISKKFEMIAAFKVSQKAKQKILQNNKLLTIEELLSKNPKGKKIRVLV